MARGHRFRSCLRRTCGVAIVASVLLATAPGGSARADDGVRIWRIGYTAHNGSERLAYVVLPAWYGPGRNPSLPVVISPHGRGGSGLANTRFWGDLPAAGAFAVISPDGMGRRLGRLSYGYAGQIDDLATMPEVAARELTWLRIDRSRVYALGSSMGGQETLLLVARHPRVLAGAAAMDSVTDLGRRYYQLPGISCDASCVARWREPAGRVLQREMREEVGGTPAGARRAYAARSARSHAREIARSGVPLQVWWSREDQIVFDQEHQSAALVRDLRQLGGCAAIVSYEGTWRHSQEMWAGSLLPLALAGFGLVPSSFADIPDGRYRGACVPADGLVGIPAVIAKGLRCTSTSAGPCG